LLKEAVIKSGGGINPRSVKTEVLDLLYEIDCKANTGLYKQCQR